jgi:hypothetical protein
VVRCECHSRARRDELMDRNRNNRRQRHGQVDRREEGVGRSRAVNACQLGHGKNTLNETSPHANKVLHDKLVHCLCRVCHVDLTFTVTEVCLVGGLSMG